MGEIFVRLETLPPGLPAFAAEDENGDYNIYIDPRLSPYGARRGYDHELTHIKLGHFRDERHVSELEKEV